MSERVGTYIHIDSETQTQEPIMKAQTAVGQKVQCNGYPGAIREVCQGQLRGMVVIQLDRGQVCICIHDLKLDNPGMFE